MAFSPQVERAIVVAAREAAPIFKVKGWEWGTSRETFIPTEEDIRAALRGLVQHHAEYKSTGPISSGRLVVVGEDFVDHLPQKIRVRIELPTS